MWINKILIWRSCFRFNLMAVVPDRRLAITHKLKSLESNKGVLQSALRQLCKIKQKMDKIKAKQEADITNNTIINLGRHHLTSLHIQKGWK